MNRAEIITLITLAAGRTDLTRAERHFLHDLCAREGISDKSHNFKLPPIQEGLREMAIRLASPENTPGLFGPVDPFALRLTGLRQDLNVAAAKISDAKGRPVEEKSAVGMEVNHQLRLLAVDAAVWRQDAQEAGRSTLAFDEVIERIKAVKRSIYVGLLDMDPSVL